jgi:DNA helicase II / ATP-dependent DNA helicase PcrA
VKLNRQQQVAVRHVDGPLLVLAGAGSGKTRVIVNRISALITDAAIPPWKILAITFTNKAANEMKTRIGAMLPERLADRITMGTFHAVCARILRIEHDALNLKKHFSIADESDQVTRIKRALKEKNYNPDLMIPKVIISKISKAKNYFETPETLHKKAGFNAYENAVADIFDIYQKGLRADQSLDFDDLITETVKLFQNEPRILNKYQDKYKYILIDEYQDTNNAQYVFVKLLSNRYRNVMAVGDDDQSIYQWRGAEISNIFNFQDDFPGAKVIKLEQNYRSTGVILKAASGLMHRNEKRNPKTLWTENKGGELIVQQTWSNDREEARAICRVIENNVRQSKRCYSDYAILYRVNAQARVLEETFQNRKIPYRVIGNISFFKRKEVKDLLAYIRLVLNTDDSVSCRRILNVPRRGIGKTSIENLEIIADKNRTDLFSAIRIAVQDDQMNIRNRAALSSFIDLIQMLKKIEHNQSAEEFVQRLLEYTGYKKMYEQQESNDSRASIEIIGEFENTVADYVMRGDESLQGFADYLSLYSDSEDSDAEVNTNQVQLMTLHNAKGLEFPCVFITGLEEELCPLIRNKQDSISVELLEEERRLLYVGMTRAREELHLYNADRRFLYGRDVFRVASRFLGEIPSECVRTIWNDENSGKHNEIKPVIGSKDFKNGDRVMHPGWGRGTVLNRFGTGPTAKLVIKFDRGFKKKLVVGLANLVNLNRNMSPMN